MTKALHRSIYTRDSELWKQVDVIVKLTDTSLSRLVEDALRSKIEKTLNGLSTEQYAQFMALLGAADVTTVSR